MNNNNAPKAHNETIQYRGSDKPREKEMNEKRTELNSTEQAKKEYFFLCVK